MILVLSGEGPSDLGTKRPTTQGQQFVPGPMAWIVDRLLKIQLDYSLIESHLGGTDCIQYLSEGDLKQLRHLRPKFLSGEKRSQGTNYHFAGAYMLGRHATNVCSERSSPVIAVFFRDADGTRSTPRNDWSSKVESMERGFRAADFATGVPMIPRPKSEAWMLCGLRKQANPAENCGWLETAPGNDTSPNSLKRQLANHLGYEPTAEIQVELLQSGRINPDQIDLSSFLAFRKTLEQAFQMLPAS